MTHCSNAIKACCLMLTLSVPMASAFAASAKDAVPVPNLQQRYGPLNELKRADISDKDRAVIKHAQQEIEAQLPNPGLKVGDRAPDFTLPDVKGGSVHLYELLKKGPVVLTFYRGAWCPYCNIQLFAYREILPQVHELGAELVAVTPQTADVSLKQAQKDRFSFPIISDVDNSVMKNYKVYYEVPEDLNKLYREQYGLDLADYNGKGRYVLPVPATYVIDAQGIIRAGYAKLDYTQRMEPADILAALHALK